MYEILSLWYNTDGKRFETLLDRRFDQNEGFGQHRKSLFLLRKGAEGNGAA